MSEKSGRWDHLETVCRVLISMNVLIVAAGYVVYFQTNHQLTSPLIPRNIIYDIADRYMKASSISVIPFLTGLWFYFAGKKQVAVILFALVITGYYFLLSLFS